MITYLPASPGMVAWFVNADGAIYALPVIAYRVDPEGHAIDGIEPLERVDACVCLANGSVCAASDEGEPAPGYLFVGTYPTGTDPREIDPHQVAMARAEEQRLGELARLGEMARRAAREETVR